MLAGSVRAEQVGAISGRSVVFVGCCPHQVCCGRSRRMRLAVALTKRAARCSYSVVLKLSPGTSNNDAEPDRKLVGGVR